MVMDISIESLVTDYGKMVSGVCRHMMQDPDLAQDASQQIWLEIIKALPGFGGEAKISTWIYSITRRVVLDFARGERLHSTRYLRGYFRGDALPIPQQQDFNKDLWVREMCDKCLTGMLHCLDNESRLIFTFRDVVGLDYPELAKIFGKNEQVIRQTVSRTRRKLRNFLKDECVLFNPHGSCHCRMKKHVEEINLPQEYEKIRSVTRSINIFHDSEKVLPGKNYWLKHL
jgi:RNA polymerase sigma-70 factor (ECF subfamily)